MANIFTIVSFCIVVTVSGIPIERLDIEFENHSQRANFSKYPCENPQPRLFHLEEISMEVWEEYKDSLREIRPHVTVLHRCQNSGCCEFNKRCKPILEKKVELVYFHTLRDKYFSIEAINHTKCQCQDYVLKCEKLAQMTVGILNKIKAIDKNNAIQTIGEASGLFVKEGKAREELNKIFFMNELSHLIVARFLFLVVNMTPLPIMITELKK